MSGIFGDELPEGLAPSDAVIFICGIDDDGCYQGLYAEIGFIIRVASSGGGVDRTNLEAAIGCIWDESLNAGAGGYKSGYHTENDRYNGRDTSEAGFWADMTAAMAGAKAINENASASQLQVDIAADKLTLAVSRLIPDENINPTALYERIKAAEALDENEYTPSSWASLQEELNGARETLSSFYDGSGAPTDINIAENQGRADGAAAALLAAADALDLKLSEADVKDGDAPFAYEYLKTLINSSCRLSSLEKSDYTEESWDAFAAVYAEGEAYMRAHGEVPDENFGRRELAELRALAARFQKAFYALESSAQDISVKVYISDNYGLRGAWPTAAAEGASAYELSLSGDERTVGGALAKTALEIGEPASDARTRIKAFFINGVLVQCADTKPSSGTYLGIYTDYEPPNADMRPEIKLHDGDELVVSLLETQEYRPVYSPVILELPRALKRLRAGYITDASGEKLSSVSVGAGEELSLKYQSSPAGAPHYSPLLSPEAGAEIFVSDAWAADVPLSADRSCGIKSAEDGSFSLAFYAPGTYTVSACRLDANDIMGSGDIPGLTSAGVLRVNVGPCGDEAAVKARLEEELTALYGSRDASFYSETSQSELERIYREALSAMASASDLTSCAEAQRGALADMQAVIDRTEWDNVTLIRLIREALCTLPTMEDMDAGCGLYNDDELALEGILGYGGIYSQLSAYQKGLLTSRETETLDRLAELYESKLLESGNSGSFGLPENPELPTFTVRVVDAESGEVLGADKWESHNASGQAKSVYIARLSRLEVDYQNMWAGWYTQSSYSSVLEPVKIAPGSLLSLSSYEPKLLEKDGESYSYVLESCSFDGRLRTIPVARHHLGSDGTAYVMPYRDACLTYYVRSTLGDAQEGLERAKEAASQAVEIAASGLQPSDYSEENWLRIQSIKVRALDDIAAALTEEAVGEIKKDAIAAIKGVLSNAASQDPSVNAQRGALVGSVHISVENTTFTSKAPEGDVPAWKGRLINGDYELYEKDSMMSVVLHALDSVGCTWTGTGGKIAGGAGDYEITYLASITTPEGCKNGTGKLGEFDGYPGSGWMGTLNDWFTNEGFASFSVANGKLEDGDDIDIYFTTNLGVDLGGTWGNSDTSIKAMRVDGGVLTPSFDPQVKEYSLTIDGNSSLLRLTPTASNKNYLVKTFLNRYNSDAAFYKRSERIPVKPGDTIYVGCGDRAWPSMNKQGAEARDYTGTTYVIKVFGASAQDIQKRIDALPSAARISYGNYRSFIETVEKLRKDYDALADKSSVNAARLEAAEAELRKFSEIDSVKEKLAQIPAKGSLNASSVGAVKAARAAYDRLSAEQQGYITVSDVTRYNEAVEWLKENGYDSPKSIKGADAIPASTVIEQKAEIKDGKAVMNIDASAVDAAIAAAGASGTAGAAGAGTITAAPLGAEGAAAVEVVVPKSSALKIASGGLAFSVETAKGFVDIPGKALAALAGAAGGPSISVKVEAKSREELAKLGIPGSVATAEVTVSSGGKALHSFGGHSIAVYVPVGEAFEEGAGCEVLVISENGDRQTLAGRCVRRDGTLCARVTTDHLSTFIVTGVKALPFGDVKDHWGLKGIRYAYERGFMSGTAADRFDPDAKLTRAMLVTILHALEGKPAAKSDSFKDVEAGKWYAAAVAWASESGVASGYADGSFRPEALITREQMAAMLLSYAKLKNKDTGAKAELSGYSDASDISAWALDALSWAKGAGIMSGRTDTLLAPKGSATRAEAAFMLMNLLVQHGL